MYYSLIGVLAIIVLLIENSDILLKRDVAFDSRVWRSYRRFLFAVLAYYVTDVLWGGLESLRLPELLFVDTTAYFLSMAACVAFWVQFMVAYLDGGARFRQISRAGGLLLALLVVALSAVNVFTPVLFTVDEAARYTPLGGRHAVFALQTTMFIWVSIFTILQRKGNTQPGKLHQRYRTLSFVSLIMAACLLLQLQAPYLPIYTIGTMLGTCRLKASVLADASLEYTRQKAEAARVEGVRKALRSLLDHMPGMAFTKDAETGVYLACNQAYADYVHHEGPARTMVGKTDADLFDEKAASQIARDDQIALSMDEPYVFFEDGTDGDGHPQQLQTTRLKYLDSDGRTCILGMSIDVTDQVRIERESAMNREAYERARSAGMIFNHIAQALARGYSDLYYVNVESGEYIEYSVDFVSGRLREITRGKDFFSSAAEDIRRFVHPEDQDRVLKALDRTDLLAELDRTKTVMITYRLVKHASGTGYVSMRATRMVDDARFIVVGILNIDEQVRQRRAYERAIEEQNAYVRLKALHGDFLWVYIIDPKTMQFREYSAPTEFDTFGVPRMGEDFFGTSRKQGARFVYPQDIDLFVSQFTEQNVLNAVREHGKFSMIYRIMLSGRPTYVQLKAALVQEHSGEHIIIGVTNVDESMRQEQAYAQRLAKAQDQAQADALTGVKNRHAFLAAEERLTDRLSRGEQPGFAIAVFDVNDLKRINDTAGHHAGDEYLLGAAKVISDLFKHSPVYRVGGDEFAVIAEREDYAHIDERMTRMQQYNEQALESGGIVIACGMSRCEGDETVTAVLDRADGRMYANKMTLKAKKNARSVG